jgi:hypothetical protein
MREAEAIIKEAFDKKHDNDAYEYGHGGYSGSFAEIHGVTVVDKTFNTSYDADEWIADHAVKWENALAVRYKVFETSKSVLRHIEAIRELNKKISEAKRKLWVAKERATNRKTTPNYVHTAQANLDKVIARCEPKIEERRAKIAEIETKLAAKSKKMVWLVGGWASS